MSRTLVLRWLSCIVTLTTFLDGSWATAGKLWNKRHNVKRNAQQQSLDNLVSYKFLTDRRPVSGMICLLNSV